MNDKIKLRAAAARLLYGNNRDSADYDMLVNYIDSSEPVQHWIPCSERLPDSTKPCLVFCSEYDLFADVWENPLVRVLSYLPKHKHWNIKSPIRVTHWMPLPEPPEMNGGCNENHTDDD